MKNKRNKIRIIFSCVMSIIVIITMSTTALAYCDNTTPNAVYIIDSKKALSIYEEYISAISQQTIKTSNGNELVNGLVQFAIEKGYIDDTPEQRDSFTKSFLRSQFAIVVDLCYAANLNMTAECLEHSLVDSPTDLIYGTGCFFSNSIFNTAVYTSIINGAKTRARNAGTGVVGYTYLGSATLNSTTDLHLSLNKVDYIVRLTRINSNTNSWTAAVTFEDVYDFEKIDWLNNMTNNTIVTIVNNYAAMAQEKGAIVPYDIAITVTASFTV